MTVCETKLSVQNNLAMPNYVIKRKDRNRHGGGVIIICKSHLKHYELLAKTTNIEVNGIKLQDGSAIFSVYVPPNTKLNSNDRNNIFDSATSVIVLGNMNAKHRTWSCNANGNVLYDYTTTRPITVIDPMAPTTRPGNDKTRPTTIDLAIVKNNAKSLTIQVLDELNSDHLPCIMNHDIQQY